MYRIHSFFFPESLSQAEPSLFESAAIGVDGAKASAKTSAVVRALVRENGAAKDVGKRLQDRFVVRCATCGDDRVDLAKINALRLHVQQHRQEAVLYERAHVARAIFEGVNLLPKRVPSVHTGASVRDDLRNEKVHRRLPAVSGRR